MANETPPNRAVTRFLLFLGLLALYVIGAAFISNVFHRDEYDQRWFFILIGFSVVYAIGTFFVMKDAGK